VAALLEREILVTLLPGSTVRADEVTELAAAGLSVQVIASPHADGGAGRG
jgi:hypothetical protein